MKQKTKIGLTLAAGIGLSAVFFLWSIVGHQPIQRLMRPESGMGDREEQLEVKMGDKKYPISVILKEQELSEQEIQRQLKEAEEQLETVFLNGNLDLQHISASVSMPSSWNGTDMTIQWYVSSWEYLDINGIIKNESLQEPEELEVQAVLTLNGQTAVWQKQIVICPLDLTEETDRLKRLAWQMEAEQQEEEAELLLPDEFAGETIVWYPKKDERWLMIAALSVVAAGAMMLGGKKEEEKAWAERERRMQLAYPDIVSRMGLYMSAGISTRKAWERIADHYRKQEDHVWNEAYEEMCTAIYEMQNGVPENTAYEHFGARCRIPSYLKLGTLLSQNLRKGTRNLTELLEEESREAFENRKALAKKMGEECESKLLLPMMLMLLTILVMILYPALASFQL